MGIVTGLIPPPCCFVIVNVDDHQLLAAMAVFDCTLKPTMNLLAL